ncbi:hypothetical protein HZA96_01330 [Candidatus Woesearchaeota archaeon]|nr:hypothetical protein [Candidatus Woesearchaeota archaeon]
MKCLAITAEGLEQLAKQEIKEILNKTALTKKTVVFFDAEKKELVEFAYKARSVKRILLLIANITITTEKTKTIQLINAAIKDYDFSALVSSKSFKVECKRFGNHQFNSLEIAGEISKTIAAKSNAVISLNAPEVIFHCYIHNNNLYFGLDIAGFNLSKRDYNIFNTQNSLNGAIAYSLMRDAELKEGETLLNHYANSGAVAIETALFLTNKSVNFYKKDKFLTAKLWNIDLKQFDKIKAANTKIICYDKSMHNITALKKNAQIAGIHKELSIGRVDTEWLDTKIDEKSVDKVIAALPIPSKVIGDKDIAPVYKEFFYQLDYVLKKKHLIVIIIEKDELLKECMDKFEIIAEKKVLQGMREYKVFIMKRKD